MGAPAAGPPQPRRSGSVSARVRRFASVSLGLALCLGCALAPAGAAAKRPARTCRVPHGQLIAARTRDAIVFTRTTRHADYTLTYWTACWRRSGRHTRVAITGESGPIGSDSSTAGPLRFSGRFLAVPVTYSQVRYGDAGLELSVYDLATGSRFYTLYSRADYAPLLMEAVLLTPAGVVAYAYRDGMLPQRRPHRPPASARRRACRLDHDPSARRSDAELAARRRSAKRVAHTSGALTARGIRTML